MLHYTSERHEREVLAGTASDDQQHPSLRYKHKGFMPWQCHILDIFKQLLSKAVTITAAGFQHGARVIPCLENSKLS